MVFWRRMAYPGFREEIGKLKESVRNASSGKQASSTYKALKQTEANISKALREVEEGLDPDSDPRGLMSMRREVRQLKKELLSRGVL